MLRKLFKETTLYSLGPQVPKIAGFFILPIITRDLTAFDYGIAALVSAYIGVLVAFKSLGLSELFTTYYYKHPVYYKLIWRHLLGFLVSYAFVFSFVQAILLFVILPLDSVTKVQIIALNVVPFIFFENINVFGSRFLQLQHKALGVASISAISGLVTVGCNLYTISYLKLGYMGWFISTFIGTMVQFVFFSSILYKNQITPIPIFRYKYLKRYLHVSLPFVPNKYGHYLLNSSDRIVMDLMQVSTFNIGRYNFGYNLGNYVQIIVTSLGIAISPFYLKLISSGDKKDLLTAKEVTNFIQIIFVILSFTGALWLREVFDILVSNDELSRTYNIAIIIVMMQNYAPIRFFFTNFIVYHEKTRFLWKITLIGGIINVVLNVLLIPKFGMFVAAITTFVAMFYISIAGFYHPEYRKIKQIELRPMFWFFLVSIMTVLVYVIRDIDVPIKLAISLLLLGLVVTLLYKKRNLLVKE